VPSACFMAASEELSTANALLFRFYLPGKALIELSEPVFGRESVGAFNLINEAFLRTH
jgi:hypothetical protein